MTQDTFSSFLNQTDNNIGHSVIEQGLATMGFHLGDGKNQISLNWHEPRLDDHDRHRPLVLVASSSLLSKIRPEFDEQGGTWSDRILAIFEHKEKGTIAVCNIGVGGLDSEVQDVNDLEKDAQKVWGTILERGGGGKVWVREKISKRIRGAHNTSALGCPSFALLDKKLPEISRSLYPKRILLTGDASKYYNFIFPVEAFPKAEFFYIPQSSNDVARALDGRGLRGVLVPHSGG
jgi:hypothetical protein